MKRKILALGLFSLGCITLFSQSAQAWGLCSGWCPRNRYVTQITCRPYNAFTPICWGNLVCDGCNPSPCGVAGGMLPLTMGVPPWACNACAQGPCMGGYCGSDGGGYASDMPIQTGPSMPMPAPGAQPNFNPPMPMPTGPNTTMRYPSMPVGVSQANFYQNYYPMPAPQYNPYYAMPQGYNPYMAMPNTQSMPYYWYNNGR